MSMTRIADKKDTITNGFTLIEMVVYVAIMAVIITALVTFTSDAIKANSKSLMLRESLDNAHRALEVITREIRHAEEIYTPTSLFGTSYGQLSLKTIKNLPEGEQNSYVDFFVEDGIVYIKQEGEDAEALTSNNVEVTDLVFTNIDPSVQINLTIGYKGSASKPSYRASTSLTTSATLRK